MAPEISPSYYVAVARSSALEGRTTTWRLVGSPSLRVFAREEALSYVEQHDSPQFQHKIFKEETNQNSTGGKYYIMWEDVSWDLLTADLFNCGGKPELWTGIYESAVHLTRGFYEYYDSKIVKKVAII